MTAILDKTNLTRPDDFYADLLAAHEGLSKAESDAYNARLILLMANHIGDRESLQMLLETARRK
ncbi:DUF2783 domain-containing protein [Roseibium aggregatum]|uniref:DUF2783 domain-containing protein n=1 Tax=Roseibium aggregatum TaxID=187304 RepID=A0A939EAG4_9HYPH|nr:DUF2783 domain-containing protein [Roseibium aggregatum]MBN9669575.1 DUF2783 domain-containing protein [Roseibium aggregatum]